MTQPKRDDEIAFYNALRKNINKIKIGNQFATYWRKLPMKIAIELGINLKRAEYLLEKWYDKGWWDCGVSVRMGWFTEDAPDNLEK